MDKEWLKNKVLERGRGAQRELARALKIDPTIVNKMLNTPRKITADEAEIIRATVAEWETPTQGNLLSSPAVASRTAAIQTDATSSGKPDVPVWASVSAGDEEGTMIMAERPIDWIHRSDTIMHVAEPFAFYIVGDSMEERFYQGDQAVVNRSAPLNSGADCVFIHQAEDGTIYGLVKRLMRSSGETWQVRQLNPRKDFTLSKRKWAKVYRIVETRLRG